MPQYCLVETGVAKTLSPSARYELELKQPHKRVATERKKKKGKKKKEEKINWLGGTGLNQPVVLST
jgi:hypothetical protein